MERTCPYWHFVPQHSFSVFLCAADRGPLWLLGQDEQFLVSIRRVSSTEGLSLITNIISHEEFQSPPEQQRRQRLIKWGLERASAETGSWQCNMQGIVNFQRERVGLVCVKKLNEKRFLKIQIYYCKITSTVQLLLSTQCQDYSFDSWGIAHSLRHDFDMTKWSLIMAQIKDSIFCLSDISMSKLFAGKLCFHGLASWPPTGITICPHSCLRKSFSKSWYLLSGICFILHPVFIDFHKVNSNPGTITNHSVTRFACNCSIIDL